MSIPSDPFILLSFVNTQLRDHYPNLSDFCKSYGIEEKSLIQKLKEINYEYHLQQNQFKQGTVI